MFDPRTLTRRTLATGLEPWLGTESLYVRELSAAETLDLVERWQVAQDDARGRLVELARSVALLAVDEQGRAVFADEQAALSAPTPFLEAVLAAAMRFNGLSEEAREQVKKNSVIAPSDVSLNGSASLAAVST